MNKRVFLVHGWHGVPEGNWRPWLKKELEKIGCEAFIPALPNTDHPQMLSWVDYLKETIGKPDENCYLIGHSLGCVVIYRYLENLKKGEKIGGAILVAGFTEKFGSQSKELSSFFNKKTNWGKIKKKCNKFIVFHSKDDPEIPFINGKILAQKLNAELIAQKGMKHYSGKDGIVEVPLILERLKNIMHEQ